jgi:hypothetical protein
MASAWLERLVDRTKLDDPTHLDVRWFAPLVSEVATELGWGSLALTELGDEAVCFDSEDWAEALPGSSHHPACHFTTGLLAAFLSAQAGVPIAVLEVECRSTGAARCRFAASSPEMMAAVWDLVAAGGDWRDALSERPDD